MTTTARVACGVALAVLGWFAAGRVLVGAGPSMVAQEVDERARVAADCASGRYTDRHWRIVRLRSGSLGYESADSTDPTPGARTCAEIATDRWPP